MRTEPLGPYERALELRTPLWMWCEDGRAIPLEIDRWRADADETDLEVVRRSQSPVLDVGCGPGRIVAAMTEHGRLALGIDVSTRAVSMTRGRGLNVLRRDVFAPLPGERRWRTIVLLDGSIGIGGDLDSLLARLHQLLAEDGQVVIETHPDPDRHESVSVRLGTHERPLGPAFAWTSIGSKALCDVASEAGFAVAESWSHAGRSFVSLAHAQSMCEGAALVRLAALKGSE